jgi:hypothetical protein
MKRFLPGMISRKKPSQLSEGLSRPNRRSVLEGMGAAALTLSMPGMLGGETDSGLTHREMEQLLRPLLVTEDRAM